MSDLTVPVSEKDHVQGSPDAPITLVEYGDYECPHCGRAYGILKSLQKKLGNELRVVFRNFPLSQMHPNAEMAAEAAEAAAAQGKFWEMHDLLFEHQMDLGPKLVIDFAGELRLDVTRFSKDLDLGTYRSKVKQDFMSGVRSGVNGTPGFFVNGTSYYGSWDLEPFLGFLKKEAVKKF
jgi:protein-disulfide isomerase